MFIPGSSPPDRTPPLQHLNTRRGCQGSSQYLGRNRLARGVNLDYSQVSHIPTFFTSYDTDCCSACNLTKTTCPPTRAPSCWSESVIALRPFWARKPAVSRLQRLLLLLPTARTGYAVGRAAKRPKGLLRCLPCLPRFAVWYGHPIDPGLCALSLAKPT